MIKKSLSVQIIALVAAIILGTVLTKTFNTDLKMVHASVGALAGLTAAVTVYIAVREKVSRAVLGLTIAALILTFLAAIGGKIAATNYDQGLMLMRIAAIAALAISLFCMYKLSRPTQK